MRGGSGCLVPVRLACSMVLHARHHACIPTRVAHALPPARPQVADTSHSDQLVLRRLTVARGDPVRALDAREAVKAAAAKVASWLGEEALKAQMEQADPLAAEQLQRLLAGQPLESPGGRDGGGSGDQNGGAMMRPGSGLGG